jgi:hypothetical protein
MWTTRAVIAAGLGLLAVLIAGMQIAALVARRQTGRGYSFIPLIPAMIGVAACLVAPWPGSAWLVPMAFVLDPTPVLSLYALVTGRLSKGA